MLNQSWNGGESSCMRLKRIAATKGNIPKMMLSILYLPVLCMTHLFHPCQNVNTVLTKRAIYCLPSE